VTAVVGRNDELAAVEDFVEDVGAGATALVIEGAAGIGKSTIWQEALAAARARDLKVLICRPGEAEAKLSFAALEDMLAPVGSDALASLPRPQRRAVDVALLRTDASGPPLEARVVSTALLSLVRRLAASSRVSCTGVPGSRRRAAWQARHSPRHAIRRFARTPWPC